MAIHKHPTTPNIKDNVVNGDSPFLEALSLKIGARVMLTYNIDTMDHLTNGSLGIVKGFIRQGPKNTITTVMVQFDEAKCGETLRGKKSDFQNDYPNATPIFKINYAYTIGNIRSGRVSKAEVIQFPLKLAWALTAHKIQGQTIRYPQAIATNINKTFTGNQAYVIHMQFLFLIPVASIQYHFTKIILVRILNF